MFGREEQFKSYLTKKLPNELLWQRPTYSPQLRVDGFMDLAAEASVIIVRIEHETSLSVSLLHLPSQALMQ